MGRIALTLSSAVNEKMDYNDPVMIKLRQAQMHRADMQKQAQMKKDASKEASKQDKAKEIIRKLQVKKDQVLRRMENDPSVEPEGGPNADMYGDELNKIDKAIEKARLVFNQPMDYDTAVGKVNEEMDGGRLFDYLNTKYHVKDHFHSDNSYIVSRTSDSKDQYVIFDYDKDKDQFYIRQLGGYDIDDAEAGEAGMNGKGGSRIAGIESYYTDGNYSPEEISIDALKKIVDHVMGGHERYAKSFADFYKDRGPTSGTVDEELNEFLGGDLKNRNQVLFDKLVPGQGDSEFVEGEMIRAMNRLVYRWYNDGDKFWEGYGTETAGPAHSFLVNSREIPLGIRKKFERLFDAVVGKYGDDGIYEKMLDELAEAVLSYVESIPEDEYTKLEQGMFNYEPEYEDEEEDDDDDYTYDYDDDEDDDYYQEGVLLEATKSIKDIKAGDVIVLGKNKHFEVDYIDPWSAGGRILVGKDVKTGKKGKMKVKFLTPRAGDTGLADETMLQVLNEGKEDEALKNKAEKANAPLGALRAIYNKGLAAFKSGHRPGANQHQWAMARVNSVLTGGPARKTDDAQWKQIQKFRKNKKKK